MVKVTWLPLPCVLKNALAFISSVPRLILCPKGLGPLLLLSYPVYFAYLLPFCCLNQKPLNIYLSVFAALSLSKVICQYLLLLVVFDTLIYRKHYDWSPRLVDHQELFAGTVVGEVNKLYPPTSPPSTSFLAPLPGSVALLVSEVGKEIFTLCCCFYICCCYLQSLWTPLLLVRCWWRAAPHCGGHSYPYWNCAL